jgi:hypothetical protein
MLRAAVRVDGVVLVVLLRASAALRDAHLGSSLHALATRRGLLADVFVANSLVHVYSECLRLRSAREVFDSIRDKNAVSWNTMLSGLLHADRCSEALLLSTGQGQQLQLHADATTLAVLLQLCKKLAAPSCCFRAVHAMALRKLLLMASTPLLDSLLDAYAKCGLLAHALRLFQRTPLSGRSVVTWSTVIAACAGRPMAQLHHHAEPPGSMRQPRGDRSIEVRSQRGAQVRPRLGAGRGQRHHGHVRQVRRLAGLQESVRCDGCQGCPVLEHHDWRAGHERVRLGRPCTRRRDGALPDVTPSGVTSLAVLSACAHGGLVQEGVAWLERLPREHFTSVSQCT